MCMDAQVPRAKDARERPMCMDAQVLRAKDARERLTDLIKMHIAAVKVSNLVFPKVVP
jgi:hypothetical protein